jgi:hypothetical protein
MCISHYFHSEIETELEPCPLCGGRRVKHIIKEGARYHVHRYHGSENGAVVHCSTKDCEDNHGYGHCILDKVPRKKMKCLKPGFLG